MSGKPNDASEVVVATSSINSYGSNRSLTHRGSVNSPSSSDLPDDIAEDAQSQNENSQTASFPGTRLHFASLLIFALLFYTGVIAIALATSQYIYARYAAEVGIEDAGRNTDSSQCKGVSNATQDLRRRAAIAQERSAKLSLYTSLAQGIPSLFSVFLLSAFSDRWGRKTSMFVPWCTTFVSFVIHVLVVLLDLPLEWLILSSLVSGLGGSFASMLASVFAMVADMTAPSSRALYIGIAEAVFTVCISVSELTVGVWIRTRGFREPVIAFAVVMTLSIVPFLCFVPETSPGSLRRRQLGIVSAEPLTWRRFTDLLSGTMRLFNSNWRRAKILISLIVAFFFLSLSFLAFGVNTLYLLGLPFCWNAEKLGYFIAASSVADQIVFVLVLGLLRSRVTDTFLASIGLASSAVQNAVFGVAFLFPPPFDDITLYLSRVAGLLSKLPSTMLRAMLSKSVTATEQGAAFGAVAFIQVFASLFAGTVTNAVYAGTVASFQGFVFFVLALWIVLSAVCVGCYSHFKRRYGRQAVVIEIDGKDNDGYEGLV
uniref:MFS domain-containing protein n=1 Tax=Macrostomum lignano TaxID=282301 RepID=A0A1I8I0X4_9PLAT